MSQAGYEVTGNPHTAARDKVVDVGAELRSKEASREYIDCEDLASTLDAFNELELRPDFDGNWEELDLSWGDLEDADAGDGDEGVFGSWDEEEDDEDAWAHASELDGDFDEDLFEGDWVE